MRNVASLEPSSFADTETIHDLRDYRSLRAVSAQRLEWNTLDSNTSSFRDLYYRMRDYEGKSLYEDVLAPWIPRARRILSGLEHYRRCNTPSNPYRVTDEDQLQWYALSRVNDYLLVSFQRAASFYSAKNAQSREWRKWMSDTGHYHLTHWKGSEISTEHYSQLVEGLGFTPLHNRVFHPFYNEIVQVTEDPAVPPGKSVIGNVFWPSLMYGNMLFSRSGIEIICHPGTLNRRIAEDSVLYFTFWRWLRETHDPSHGSGPNSQWATSFRRDYIDDDIYYFNVDGTCSLNIEVAAADDLSIEPHQPDDLTIQERIELLTYRSFVNCTKHDYNRWPYDDTYSLSSWLV